MKVVFLDIDGVLNASKTFERRYNKWNETGVIELEIDEFRLEYLKEIIDKTDSKIVLSSTWRFFFENNDGIVVPRNRKGIELYNLFNKYDLEIYDLTTKNNYLKREDQINLWISNHNDVDSFVVIDDESSDLKSFIGKQLIKTSIVEDGEILTNMDDCIGLSEKPIEEAIEILNSKVKKLK